jgi:hypothetical protein
MTGRLPITLPALLSVRGIVLAAGLSVSAACADPVVQQSFKFIDHSIGMGDRPCGLTVLGDNGKEIATLVALDTRGKVTGVSFLSTDEWKKFLVVWDEAKVALAGGVETKHFDPQIWDYTDSTQTELSIQLTYLGLLRVNIRELGSRTCTFDIQSGQVSAFDAAVAKISARFQSAG